MPDPRNPGVIHAGRAEFANTHQEERRTALGLLLPDMRPLLSGGRFRDIEWILGLIARTRSREELENHSIREREASLL
jgi:hypothetical protein